jgi:hypothetical protein
MVHQHYLKSKTSLTILNNGINDLNKRLLSLFQTNIEDILKNKFQLTINMETETTSINTWYYWEYEQYIRLLNEKIKEENDESEKRNKDHQEKYSNISNFNPSKMMNNFGKNLSGLGNNTSFPRI